MDESSQQPVTVAEVARVGIDLPCIGCGYNLRSLPMSGRCPECNSAIESALHHGWLMFADPQWLKRLRGGVTLILWTLLAIVLSYIGYVATLIVIMMPGGIITSNLAVQVPFLTIGLGIAIAWLVSAFKLTAPEPSGATADPLRRGLLSKLAATMSAMPIVLIILVVCRIALWTTDFFGFYEYESVRRLLGIGGYAASLVGGVGFVLLMVLMRRIARRIPRKGLGKLMSVLAWGMAGLTVGGGAGNMFDIAPGVIGLDSDITCPVETYGPIPAGSVIFIATTTTGTATTIPSTQLTTMPVFAGTTAGFFGGLRPVVVIFALVFKTLAFCWSVCGVVAVFWFRSVFSRAIAENVAHQIEGVARQ